TGDVLVKSPGSVAFVPLTGPAQLPVGTIVDARKGKLQITVDDGLGHLLTGVGSGGEFILTQPVGAAQGSRAHGAAAAAPALATLVLYGGASRHSCGRPHRGGRSASAARKHKRKHK